MMNRQTLVASHGLFGICRRPKSAGRAGAATGRGTGAEGEREGVGSGRAAYLRRCVTTLSGGSRTKQSEYTAELDTGNLPVYGMVYKKTFGTYSQFRPVPHCLSVGQLFPT